MPAERRPVSIAAIASLAALGVLTALAIVAALAPEIMPSRGQAARAFAAAGIFVASYLALAIGRIPGLSIDRAGIALVGASLMVASGAISLDAAYRAIDIDTLTLLLGMMIIVANLRLSGFFALATHWLGRHARSPVMLLAMIVLISGVASAFLVNDAICLVLAPLVVDLALTLRRRPLPYLLAVAMASNIGSTATLTGNPQNMLIGSFSGIPYVAFAAALAPVAVVGLAVLTAALLALHRSEFHVRERLEPHQRRIRVNRALVARSLLATLAVIALFFAGQPPAKAAIIIGALLLLTRRVKSGRVYAEIDWSLLLMFAGLFIIVAAAEQRLLSPGVVKDVARLHLERAPVLSAVTAILSNLVSNVPAVLLLKPFVAALPDHDAAWKIVAMASTLAGNFTLLGSVANLIVAEKAAQRGVTVGFWQYFRVGSPVTVLLLVIGTLWLSR